MSYIISFPVLAIVIAAYLLMAPAGGMFLDGDAYTVALPSGAEMTLRGGEVFVIAGLVALLIDLLKGPHGGRPGRILLAATFLAAIVCFLFYAPAASPAFLLLALMSLVAALAAFMKS
jgi:hypothetical protein